VSEARITHRPPGSLDGLPPLREILAEAGIAADKRFGQHFLFDLNLCRKIARLAGPIDGDTVLEVGPGPGGLTRALVEAGANVVVVEKDARFIPLLRNLARAANGRLTVVEGDALAVDESRLLSERGGHVVSNLPYNVGTPLLVKWLTGAFRPTSMTLMFQKEVARRIVAQPGAGDYGRLAVLSQALCDTRIVLDLPARAFTPPPKVASAVVRLTPLATPRPADHLIEALQSIAQAAFGQRRKMLRSSLKLMGGEALCLSARIDPDSRAETVPVAGFLNLAQVWLGERT
jgi:16S rRNA (adenine1518-N6/adenine1519-N6)-dimethyltransferase